MRFINSNNNDSTYNLVAEKYLVDNYKEDIFMLWIANPGVYVGRNQNTYEQVNLEYLKENDFELFRRLSGGGTIFHDHGNLYFSFITKNTKETVEEKFKKFTKPIVKYLNHLGANAQFVGRNDIKIDDQKISGNAQWYQQDIIVHHGSLLFNVDFAKMAPVLTPTKDKYKSKSVDSKKAKVTNILPHLKNKITIETFKEELFNFIKSDNPDARFEAISKEEDIKVKEYIDTKYGTWMWNYGKNPKFSFSNAAYFKGGLVKINLNTEKNVIIDINITGDFFSKLDIELLNELLLFTNYEKEAIKAKLDSIELSDYIANVTKEELLSLFF